MSGDYSKRSFHPEKNYQDVLLQQGRVVLDSDWNEAAEIHDRRQRAEMHDVVGVCGVSQQTSGGFRITFDASKTDLAIGIGRIYVNGISAENHGTPPTVFDPALSQLQGTTPAFYHEQPYFPTAQLDAPLSPPAAGEVHLVYLDVWQRETTYLQDPELVEQAVGVDTSTRRQTVWQVRILENVAADVGCGLSDDQLQGWADLIKSSAGRLTTDVVPPTDQADPCLIPPTAGYRGLENRLYRVEIHDRVVSGTDTNWRFKFSRDNAAVAAAVEEILADRTQIKVSAIGRDKVMRFRVGDWIEILDDHTEFRQSSGVMAQVIEPVNEAAQILTLDRALPDAMFDASDRLRHTRIRRWDQSDQGVDADGLLVVGEGPIELDDGVVIEFNLDPDVAGGDFKVGDHWLFAARTADGSVESLQQAPPHGNHHHFCRLALLSRKDGQVHVLDSRKLFPTLSEVTQLKYVGGDGQEADSAGKLGEALEVALFNGQLPVAGAKVRFEILGGIGGNLQQGSLQGTTIDVDTDASGVASCSWTLETAPDQPVPSRSQQVQASVLDRQCQPTDQRVRFNARIAELALRYVSGDGQETQAASFVPGDLIAGVEDAIGRPHKGVDVRFRVDRGGGRVRAVGGPLQNSVTVTTDPQGLARAQWQIGNDPTEVNLVTAELIDAPQGQSLPLQFRSVIERPASGGGGKCTVTLGRDGIKDLQHAVQQLPPAGGCICIPSEEFIQKETVDLSGLSRITFEGCGPASIIHFTPDQSSPLFHLSDATEIHFRHFSMIGRDPAESLIDIGSVRDCTICDCSFQAAQIGVRAMRSLSSVTDLTIEDCRFQNQQLAVAINPEGGRVERILVHRNQVNAIQGLSISSASLVTGELSDNTILAKQSGLLVAGTDLLVARNQVSCFSDRFAVEILVASTDASIRVADNTILANAGSGISYRNDPGRLAFSGNRVEVAQIALAVHRSSFTDGTGSAQIEGNRFSSSSKNDQISVVVCGDVDTPGDTLLAQMIFSSNQVTSARDSTEKRPAVYLNSTTLICTNNLVQEPSRGQFTSIRTPSNPRPRGIMAHNVTTSGVSPVNGHTQHNLP